MVTSSCIVHTWLLPHLYSPLSTLYVLCGTQGTHHSPNYTYPQYPQVRTKVRTTPTRNIRRYAPQSNLHLPAISAGTHHRQIYTYPQYPQVRTTDRSTPTRNIRRYAHHYMYPHYIAGTASDSKGRSICTLIYRKHFNLNCSLIYNLIYHQY